MRLKTKAGTKITTNMIIEGLKSSILKGRLFSQESDVIGELIVQLSHQLFKYSSQQQGSKKDVSINMAISQNLGWS